MSEFVKKYRRLPPVNEFVGPVTSENILEIAKYTNLNITGDLRHIVLDNGRTVVADGTSYLLLEDFGWRHVGTDYVKENYEEVKNVN